MLTALVALFSCGVMLGLAGVRLSLLCLTSAFVALAYVVIAGLAKSISFLTALETFVLLTALQAGYLACLAAETTISDLPAHRMPLFRTVKLFAVALALATGAFVITMLKDPPQSVASDPTAPPARAIELQVPAGLPTP
jgi:hypothetical protein